MRLFTYGYDSYPIDYVIDHLVSEGVRHVVDVRYQPYSRNPDYRPGPLSHHLATVGIRYTHMRGLGNVNYKGGPIALANPSKIEDLRQMVESQDGVCIICVCKKADDCHRRLISDTLQGILDVEVIDL